MPKRLNHTSCKKGKRVFVRLRDGREFVEKFIEKKGRFVILENEGKIATSDLEIFTINQPLKGRKL